MLRALTERLRRLTSRTPDEPAAPALVLSGGGARAAYQAGVLQYIAEVFPDESFPIVTGVSAGA